MLSELVTAHPTLARASLVALGVPLGIALWRLAREETVDEDGRARVTWHGPHRWPGRVRERVAANRAARTSGQRRTLARMEAAHDALLSLASALLAIALLAVAGVGLWAAAQDPSASAMRTLIIGAVGIAAAAASALCLRTAVRTWRGARSLES